MNLAITHANPAHASIWRYPFSQTFHAIGAVVRARAARHFISLMIAFSPMTAFSDCLTLERIYGSPALSGASLREIKVSPDGNHVSFLKARPDNQFQFDLWAFKLADGSMVRLVDSQAFASGQELSEAEKARRERQRTAMLAGITSYTWTPDGKQILLPVGEDLYLLDVAAPSNIRRIASGEMIDPQVSPRGRYLSFVRGQNLFVIEISTGKETQLTTDGGGTIHNAEAEFVAQEEMDQESGYWWAPDDSAIAFKRFDESPVPVVRRFEIQADRTDVIEQRYPAAGDPNVLVDLAIVDVASAKQQRIDLGANRDIYLVRADWSPDARNLLYQRQSRDQKQLDLVRYEVASGSQKTVVTETSPTWVTVGGKPHFLKANNRFIWASERDGWNHLYLYDLDGRPVRTLTTGEWQIDDILGIDEPGQRVFVTSNRDAVIDKQVYSIALGESHARDKPRRITVADGWHEARFSEHANIFVDTWSDPVTAPQISVRRADGTLVTWLEHNEVQAGHPYYPYLKSHLPTEFGELKASDGQILHYSLIKPLGFDPSRRYPVFFNVYGGPHVQLVARRWGALLSQFMAQHGYIVFEMDNRGSYRRERRFTDVIYRNLGKHEVEDQLGAVDWLRGQSFVDPDRIGVFGWSYGGFMTLRLLEAGSDRIALGVAGAPVTDWSLYDTHYTEHFMSKPQDNPDGYADSGVFAHLDGLRSPLLLLHGMADDNVLFANSTRLMSELQKRGVLFSLMTYPGAKHGISNPAAHLHVMRTLFNYFETHFKSNPAIGGADQCVASARS